MPTSVYLSRYPPVFTSKKTSNFLIFTSRPALQLASLAFPSSLGQNISRENDEYTMPVSASASQCQHQCRYPIPIFSSLSFLLSPSPPSSSSHPLFHRGPLTTCSTADALACYAIWASAPFSCHPPTIIQIKLLPLSDVSTKQNPSAVVVFCTYLPR